MLSRLGIFAGLLLASACGEGTSEPVPTFNRDVAPLVFEHCAPCHRPAASGPFDLLTYDDVRKRARQIVRVIRRRYMPPWLPAAGNPHFVGDRRLPDVSIDRIVRWVEAGTPEGNPVDLPDQPRVPGGWRLGSPDLVVRMADPFEVPAEGRDVFRNFVISIPVETPRWVTAVEIRPGNPRVVHHGILAIDPTLDSRLRAARDAPPGFPGMSLGRAQMPDGLFVGWTPGKAPAPLAKGTAFQVVPGADFVLQLHMVTSGRMETVQPEIGLHFGDPPTRKTFSLTLFSEKIDIPPGESDHVVVDQLVLPVDVRVLSVYPHAHYVGRTLEAKALLPDGSERWLLRIPDWDFDWQDEYRYADPPTLPAGTQVGFRYVYDNSKDNPRNPNQPPARIRFGEQSVDEMGTLTLQVEPVVPGQVEALRVAQVAHDVALRSWDWELRNHAGVVFLGAGRLKTASVELEAALKLRPDYPDALCNLARVRLEQGRPADADELLQRCLKITPGHGDAHRVMGVLHLDARRWGDALEHLRKAVSFYPHDAEIRANLANALALTNLEQDALREYGEALRLRPEFPEAWNNLANTHFSAGRFDQAIAAYERAIELRPDYFNARFNLGRCLLARGRGADAVSHLETALRLQPGHAGAQAALAAARGGR